jgi:chromosome segregation ATPase
MAEDEARLAQIERVLARLELTVREGWVGMDKQLDAFRREAESGQRDLSLRVQGLHSRLDAVDQRFTDLQARLTGMDSRLGTLDARLESRLAGIDDRLNTRLMGVEGQLSQLRSSLDHKAGNWVVSLWGATLAFLVAAATAIITYTLTHPPRP